jgi:demethylmenaquinone methyltransferase/2-methoxy-6-polyprenyl-1,4-benzoquinol methylase
LVDKIKKLRYIFRQNTKGRNGNMIESKITEMENYYAKRALEYENIYLRPERQECIKQSKNFLKMYFHNKDILEIACGTGFWTKTISEVSTKITATDLNEKVLEVAKNKKFNCKIDFIQDDSYKLEKITEKHNSLFAGFWFSHIPKSRVHEFVEVIHKKLHEHAIVVFMDNLYVEGNSTPISRVDTEGNSYQNRKLKDNSQHEILKNFYAEDWLFLDNPDAIKPYRDNYQDIARIIGERAKFWFENGKIWDRNNNKRIPLMKFLREYVGKRN